MTVTYVAQVVTGTATYSLPLVGHEWPVEGGYFAPVVGWLMPKEYAAAILSDLGSSTGATREVSLNIGDPNDPGYVQVSRVVVIGTAPADNPQELVLLLSDVRWYFGRMWFAADANVRRRVGETSLIGDTLTSQTAVNTVAWAPWAINNPTFAGSGVVTQGAPWTWSTFKDAVLTYLTSARSTRGFPLVAFVTDTFSVLDIAAQILQETVLDGEAGPMIARVIESVPGASIYVDLAGTIHVYESTPSAETTLCLALPEPLWGAGAIVKVDRSGLRPRSGGWWRVYMDMELELRLNYSMATTVGVNDPFLVPVIQVTDRSLTIPAGIYLCFGTAPVAQRTVGQYSWIGQDEAFAAWYYNQDGQGTKIYGTHSPSSVPSYYFPTPVGFSSKLTDDIIAQEWFGGGLDQLTLDPVTGLPNPVWVSRVAELRSAFRTYFRVNPIAWDRIRHAFDTRCSIWDVATGTRGDSPVYCNYAYVPFDPTIYSPFPDQMVNNICYNVSGLINSMVPTGFVLKLVDEELGIFAIDRSGSTTRARLWKEQSIEVSDVILIPNYTNTGGISSPNSISEAQLRLSDTGSSSDWKLSTVVSVMPAAPNDPRRFYEVLIDTQTVAAAAGWNGFAQLGYGPDQELRTQLGEARIAWRDDSDTANGIYATIGFNDGTAGNPVIGVGQKNDPDNYTQVTGGGFGGSPPLYGGTSTPTGLVPINLLQEVIPLALATAVADFLTKIDCYVGVQRIQGTKVPIPIGTIRRIVHRVNDHKFETEIHAVEPDQHAFKPQDFLFGAARASLLQTIARTGRGSNG